MSAFDDPKWDEYLKHAAEELRPMVENSALMATLFSYPPDPKLAIETGYGVLLDKPFIVVHKPGTKLPENLRRLAMVVVEADITTDEGKATFSQAVLAMTENPTDERLKGLASKARSDGRKGD